MAKSEHSPALIRTTVDHLSDHLERLRRERKGLDERIAETERAIAAWSAELKAQDGQKPRRRRPRGANREAVKRLFDEHPEAVLTLKEIAEQTGLRPSSVQTVLKKMDEIGLVRVEGDKDRQTPRFRRKRAPRRNPPPPPPRPPSLPPRGGEIDADDIPF